MAESTTTPYVGMSLAEYDALYPPGPEDELTPAPKVGMTLEEYDALYPESIDLEEYPEQEFDGYIAFDELPDNPSEVLEFFPNLPEGSVKENLLLLARRRESNIPLDIDISTPEKLNDYKKELIINQLVAKGYNLNRNKEGEWTHYYNAPIEDLGFRAKFGLLDTDAERRGMLEGVFGEGKVSRDGAGRWMYWNEELNKGKGAWSAVDSEAVELADIADAAEPIAKTLAEIGAMFLVPELQGPRWVVNAGKFLKFGAEVGAPLTVHAQLESLENSLGLNMESPDAQMSRFYQEAMEYTGWAIGTRVAALGINRFWSPIPGGVGSEERRLVRDVHELNAIRDARNPEEWAQVKQRMEQFNDLPQIERNALLNDPNRLWSDFKLRTSQVNSAPLLSRVEGILSKFPGSSGVYKDNVTQLQQAVDEEVAWLLRDVPNMTEYAPTIKRKFQEIVAAKQLESKSFYDKYVSGIDPNTGGRITKDAIERVKLQFREEGAERYDSLDLLIKEGTGRTDSQFVSTKFLKDEIAKIRDEASNIKIRKVPSQVLDAAGNPIAEVTTRETQLVGMTPAQISYYEKLDDLPDKISFAALKRQKDQFGDIMSGSMVVADISARDTARLYNALNEGVKDLEALEKSMSPAVAAKFKKELEDTNAWYEMNHSMFSDNQGAFARIISKYKETSGGMFKLVRSMMGGGNEAYVRKMYDVMTPEELAKFKSVAQDYAMDGKTPQQMVKYLNNPDTQSTYLAVFGRDQLAAMKDFAGEMLKFQRSAPGKLAKESSNAMALLNRSVKQNDYSTFKQLVDELGEGSKDVEVLRTAFMAKLIQRATKQTDNSLYSTVDGKELLNQIDSTFGTETVRQVLGDTKYKNLRLLAEISKATRSGDAAGGLASGMFIMNTLRTANFMQAGMFAAKAWVAAKMLSSDAAQTWLTREPLSAMTQTQWRAAIASTQLLGEEVQGKSTLKTNAQHLRYQRYRPMLNPRIQRASELGERVMQESQQLIEGMQ